MNNSFDAPLYLRLTEAGHWVARGHLSRSTLIRSTEIIAFHCVAMAALMVSLGAPRASVFLLVGGVFIQWLLGSSLIYLVMDADCNDTLACFLGAPLGFGLFGLGHVFLVELGATPHITYSSLVVGCVSVSSLIFLRSNRLESSTASNSWRSLLVVAAFVSVALFTTQQYPRGIWSALSVAIMSGFHILSKKLVLKHNRVRSSVFVTGVSVLTCFAIAEVIRFVVRFDSSQQVYDHVIYPLFKGTDDQVFSEQMSTSIATWGIFENSAAVGQMQRYHWLTLAWSGSLNAGGLVQPWISTLYLVPVVSLTVVGQLLATFGRRYGHTILGIWAAVYVFFADSLPELGVFYFANNTSNIAAMMWLGGAIGVIVLALENKIRRPTMVTTFFVVMLTLAKGPYLAGVLTGLMLAFVFSLLSGRSNCEWQRTLQLFLSSVLGSLLTYIAFIRSPDTTSYVWSPDQFLARFPHPIWVPSDLSGFYRPVYILATLLGLVLFRFAPAVALVANFRALDISKVFLLGGCLAGILTFVLDGKGATFYFLGSSFLFSAFSLCRLNINVQWNSLKRRSSSYLVLGLFVAGGFLVLSQDIRIGAVLAPTLALVGAAFVHNQRLHNSQNCDSSKLSWILVLTVVAVFLGLAQQIPRAWFAESLDPPLASNVERLAGEATTQALAWVRTNTSSNAILATNRYLCPSTVVCNDFPEDLSSNSSRLVSAVARRRVLIEGPRFTVNAKIWQSEYPSWIQDRVDAIYAYLKNQSEDTRSQLKSFGVDFIIIDKQSLVRVGLLIDDILANENSRVKFENSTTLIIEI